MLLKQGKRLERAQGDIGKFWSSCGAQWLCCDELRRYWTLPRGVRAVWLSFHDAPARDRWCIDGARFKIPGELVHERFIRLPGDHWVWVAPALYTAVRRMLRLTKGKPIYAELEYEVKVEA